MTTIKFLDDFVKSGRINEIPLISPLLHLEKKLKMSWKCRVKVCYYDIVDKKESHRRKRGQAIGLFFFVHKSSFDKGKEGENDEQSAAHP